MRFSTFSVAVAAVLCLSLVGGVGGAIAQESNETDDDRDIDPETMSVDDLEGIGEIADDETEYLQEVDGGLRIVAWEYVDGQFYVTFEADESKRVTMSEWVPMDSEGTGEGAIRRHSIPEGTSTVSVAARTHDGDAAISISTSQSIREGRYSYVSTGMAGWTLFSGPATWTLAGLGGLSASVGTFWGTKRYLEKQERDLEERQLEVID